MRLIQSKDLLQLFEQRVMSSKKIDIASAWATSSKSLGTLARTAKGRDIRSIIGTSGRATDPDALDELERIGELCLAEQYPMFHPKAATIWRRNASVKRLLKARVYSVSPAASSS